MTLLLKYCAALKKILNGCLYVGQSTLKADYRGTLGHVIQ